MATARRMLATIDRRNCSTLFDASTTPRVSHLYVSLLFPISDLLRFNLTLKNLRERVKARGGTKAINTKRWVRAAATKLKIIKRYLAHQRCHHQYSINLVPLQGGQPEISKHVCLQYRSTARMPYVSKIHSIHSSFPSVCPPCSLPSLPLPLFPALPFFFPQTYGDHIGTGTDSIRGVIEAILYLTPAPAAVWAAAV